ncbi:hypothetical protein [Rhodobacter capsulatus]|uniref:hypothetical protein n=1 Tax=Rhodobacter capsulatus TaxID=1061 RepID=UPI001142777A|nr:hypothetical protein [Rhodobacter capsulatus]
MPFDACFDATNRPTKRFFPACWGRFVGVMSQWRVPGRNARDCFLRRFARSIDVVRAATFLALCPVSAAAEPLPCLPPDPPSTALPAAVLTDYRAEISAEFESYFAQVGPYIACLDAERSRSLDEARLATQSYAAFLDTNPASEHFQ